MRLFYLLPLSLSLSSFCWPSLLSPFHLSPSDVLLIDDHQICEFFAQLKAATCCNALCNRLRHIDAANLICCQWLRKKTQWQGRRSSRGGGKCKRCYYSTAPPPLPLSPASAPTQCSCYICIDLCAGGNIKSQQTRGSTTSAGIGIAIRDLDGELALRAAAVAEAEGPVGPNGRMRNISTFTFCFALLFDDVLS